MKSSTGSSGIFSGRAVACGTSPGAVGLGTICTPAANACNGEKLATCDVDGGHFSATSTNCATTNNVCTLAATCALVAEDTAGDTSTSQVVTSYMLGNIYRVDRARTLTKVEQYLAVTGISVFTWVVYEAASSSGTFTKIAEATTSDSGTGSFLSSGALNVPLVAGKYYFLGVVVQGSFTRYYQSAAPVPFVSFGQLLNSYQVSATTPPVSPYISSTSAIRYNQRISTSKAL